MRTYKLYQVSFVQNVSYFTYVTECQATDYATAEHTLLSGLTSDIVEYIITVQK